MDSTDPLRSRLRRARRGRTATEATFAAEALRVHAVWGPIRACRSVAAYVAVDGEIDPTPLVEELTSVGAQSFLPVLTGEVLRFGPVGPDTPTAANRYGIAEPVGVETVAADQLDLVLVPVVGVDPQGNRLGFGAGWYDRTFSWLRDVPRPSRPLLVGLAHDVQVVDVVPSRPWDVRLDAVITPTRRIGVTVDAG